MDNNTDNVFGRPIHGYTDQEAIRDGLLVPVPGGGGVNRVTRAVLKVEPDDGWRVGTYGGKTLWLIPNEVGGLTLMFPEDY